MKLIIFLGLIVVSFCASLVYGINDLKYTMTPLSAIFKTLIINITILGSGSIWWFVSETDGISQGIGVMIYLGSIVAIVLIMTVIIFVYNKKLDN